MWPFDDLYGQPASGAIVCEAQQQPRGGAVRRVVRPRGVAARQTAHLRLLVSLRSDKC